MKSDSLCKRWTRTEYRRLTEMGILEDGRVELVNGTVWMKIDKSRRHIAACTRLLKALSDVFGFHCLQVRSSLPLSEYDDPEPDIAVLARDLDQYVEEEPTPHETLLVVEASELTLEADIRVKSRQYGNAGILEYWVVDLPNCLLHIFREPTSTGYASVTVLTTEDEVRPLAAPDSVIRVADLLP